MLANATDLEPDCAKIWIWYQQIARRRQNGGFGANPLTYTEVDAWCRRTKTDPTPDEIDLLFVADDGFLDAQQED